MQQRITTSALGIWCGLAAGIGVAQTYQKTKPGMWESTATFQVGKNAPMRPASSVTCFDEAILGQKNKAAEATSGKTLIGEFCRMESAKMVGNYNSQ
jgi:hypothetical protein